MYNPYDPQSGLPGMPTLPPPPGGKTPKPKRNGLQPPQPGAPAALGAPQQPQVQPNTRATVNPVQMQDPYGPMKQNIMGQITSQIAGLGHMMPAITQPNADLATALGHLPDGYNWQVPPHVPSPFEMEASNLPNQAYMPNQYDAQGLQAQAQQQGATAGLGVLQQHPLNPIGYQQYNAGAYPGLSLPETPARPAPHPSLIAQGLSAIGGAVAPSYAGQINASPLEAAQRVSQMQFEDRQRQYSQALEQAQMQHANAVAGRQDAMSQFAYNEGNRQRLGEYNNSLQTQDRNAAVPLAQEQAGAGTLAGGLPIMSNLQRVGLQSQGENALLDKYSQAQQQLYGMGIQRTAALDSVLARILGIEQQRDYHNMLGSYYQNRNNTSAQAETDRTAYQGVMGAAAATRADAATSNADSNAIRADAYKNRAGIAQKLGDLDAQIKVSTLMQRDPAIALQHQSIMAAITNRNRLGQALESAKPENRAGAEAAVNAADADLEKQADAYAKAIQAYKGRATPNTPGRTNGPNPHAPAAARAPSRYGPPHAGAPTFDPNAPVIR